MFITPCKSTRNLHQPWKFTWNLHENSSTVELYKKFTWKFALPVEIYEIYTTRGNLHEIYMEIYPSKFIRHLDINLHNPLKFTRKSHQPRYFYEINAKFIRTLLQPLNITLNVRGNLHTPLKFTRNLCGNLPVEIYTKFCTSRRNIHEIYPNRRNLH